MLSGFINNEFNKIINKALARYASDWGVTVKDVQLMFHVKLIDDEPIVVYTFLKSYNPVCEVVDFKRGILNIKTVDLKGYSHIVPPYILRILANLSLQQNSDNVCVIASSDGSNVTMWMYDNKKPIKKIILDEVLSFEEMITEGQ